MLNPITFTIDRESGPVTVTATGSDYVAYEDKFDKAAIQGISEGRYKTFMFLVWHAMKRENLTDETFDEFINSTPTFGGPEQVDDVPPLESKPAAGM